MRSTLPEIVAQLGADVRTLRRAAERGTVRCRRPGPRDDAVASPSALARRIEDRIGVPVDVARLSRIRKESPLLLQAIDEGRVLVDRDVCWDGLRRGRETRR